VRASRRRTTTSSTTRRPSPTRPTINAAGASAIAVGDGVDAYEPFELLSRSQMAGFLTRTLAGLEDTGLITPRNGMLPASGTGVGDLIPCNGGRCDGGEDNDTLVASNGAEQVIGNGGDDDIELDAAFPGGQQRPGSRRPSAGDCIDGGAGGDLMVGGAGDDDRPCEFTAFVDPRGGADGWRPATTGSRRPGQRHDERHHLDDDVLVGGTGNDVLRDGSPMDADRLFGGRDDDMLDARDGDSDDVIHGGPGEDDCSGDADDTFVDCERITKL
jgi:Ca2+-binding RTX toxin-like protein